MNEQLTDQVLIERVQNGDKASIQPAGNEVPEQGM